MSLLEGKLVRLAALQRSDLSTFMRWFRDEEIRALLVLDHVGSLTSEAEDEWYERGVNNVDERHFSIRTLRVDHLIGNCALFGVTNRERTAEFGICIGEKEYWGRGYGSDAIEISLRYAFAELNLDRVRVEVIGFNERAIRVYEKLGFVQQGCRRQAVCHEGMNYDLHSMAITRSDWYSKQR